MMPTPQHPGPETGTARHMPGIADKGRRASPRPSAAAASAAPGLQAEGTALRRLMTALRAAEALGMVTLVAPEDEG
ncbi:hypothetical protein [Neotabrizicola sp. sgz301269]|uniref:hypothetical protein n=1 Tax=Neotabrizicola sp. sgz301269 TaxID=3276282 RepID=UPI00376FD68E